MTYFENIQKLKRKANPLILGIESSCDETACAIVRGREILANEIISSATEQAKYGGVVPEIASRAHTDAIDEVVRRAVKSANIKLEELDGIAVTYGAGLLGALLVGVSFAKALALSLNIPLIAVNHIRGHMAAAYLDDKELKPPFITLLASGGHTAVIHTTSYTDFEVLGSTRDDAVGEAFDKVARILSLQYPGGPNIERASKEGNNSLNLPKMLKGEDTFDFSYSGLKTAVINYCHTLEQKGEQIPVGDVAKSFQTSAIDILVERVISACKKTGIKTVTAGGGVVANTYLRESLKDACDKNGYKLVLPEKKYCTDNASMIAEEGVIQYMAGNFADLSLNAKAQIKLGEKGKIIK